VRAHDKDINTVAVSPNDFLVASGSQDKKIRIFKQTDLSPISTLVGHKRGVWKVVFSPVDKTLASCSGDRTIRLWSMVDNTCIRLFEGHTASVVCVKFLNKGTQVVSGSADGLLRLWTIRTGECENTFDEHMDKVWTICTSPVEDDIFISGGSDSKILFWRDVTETEEKERLEKEEEVLLVEQQMYNDIRGKRYEKALAASIGLGHSHRTLTIISAVLEDEDDEEKKDEDTDESRSGRQGGSSKELGKRLDKYLSKWADKELTTVVPWLKDWNTNAKHAFVAQCILQSLMRCHGANALTSSRVVCESLASLVAYSERHFQ